MSSKTATPERAMKPMAAEIENGISRSQSAKMPPTQPKGTPVNLIANIDLLGEKRGGPAEELAHAAKVADLLLDLKKALKSLPDEATDEQLRAAFARDRLGPRLLEFSKCPDFVVNRGHYFGTGYVEGEPALSDEDKRALIEFLKTF